MSVVITKEDLIAYAEVDYIIKHMNEKYISKLPEKLVNFFDTMKDPEHEIYIHPYKPLQSQGLMKYTLEIVALLHVKYWCENEERKEQLLQKMKDNQEKFEAQLQEKFNVDNIFQNSNQTYHQEIHEEDPVVTAFSKYTVNNPDIQDYTDVEEDTHHELVKNIEVKKSLFEKLKNFIKKIIGKGTD